MMMMMTTKTTTAKGDVTTMTTLMLIVANFYVGGKERLKMQTKERQGKMRRIAEK